MGINFTDFSRNHLYQDENSQESSALANALNRHKLMNAPKNMEQEQRKQELANAFAQMQNQYYEPQADVDIRHKEAMIEKAMRDGDFGGLTGSLGNAAKLYKAEQRYGDTHPLIQSLKKIQQLEQDRERGILAMQQANMAALPARFLTNEGRTLNELEEVKSGHKLGSSITGRPEKLAPAQAAYQRAHYERHLFNQVTSEQLRDRLRGSADVHTTLSTIDPSKLFKYSGGTGAAAKALAQGRSSLTKKESEEYTEYEENKTRVKTLAKHLSRFFGSGAAEGTQKDIEYISNPESISYSPKVAERKFKALIDVFEKESHNLREAATNPDFYGARSPDVRGSQNNAQQAQGEGSLGLVRRIRQDQGGNR